MTILELVQRFCRRTGIPVPTSVVGSTDSQILQALALVEEDVNDLAVRHDWQALLKQGTHTTLASEDQGDISTIAPGFRYIVNESMWDQTLRLPVLGPLDSKEWQALKSVFVNGPRYQFRFRGNHLLVNPAPVAGHTWLFEYVSKYAILDTNGTTTKEFFTADTDTFLLPDDLHLLGLRWRWLREKGLDYAELFETYEFQVKDAMGRDGGAPRVSMDEPRRAGKPGIYIPQGNWFTP